MSSLLPSTSNNRLVAQGKKRGREETEETTKSSSNILKQSPKKKRHRVANRLQKEAKATKPQKPKTKAKTTHVTAFDKARTQALAGLYMAENYVEDIVADMEKTESSIKPDYFTSMQADIKPRMRTILFGWLTEVHSKFEMKPIVLWRTFHLVDCYLSLKDVKREDFQRLGCAALWVSSKYHEIYPPMASDLVHMSDNAFTKEKLIKMEAELCDTLNYKFTQKTPYQFLDRYTNIAIHGIDTKAHAKLDSHTEHEKLLAEQNIGCVIDDPVLKKCKRVKFLARYCLERWNLTHESLGRPAKNMAAQALYTAMSLTSNKWTPELTKATGFSEIDLRKETFQGGAFVLVKKVILGFFDKEHDAVIRKYSSPLFGSVSTLRKRNPRAPRV